MTWYSILGEKLLTSSGESFETAKIVNDAKYVALYFSAHYCGPCRKFTPMFSVLYEDRPTKDIEVIFISNDTSNDEFNEYFEDMPWYAVPFDLDELDKIKTHYDVSGIPRVIVIDSQTGEIVNNDARGAIASKKVLSIESLKN